MSLKFFKRIGQSVPGIMADQKSSTKSIPTAEVENLGWMEIPKLKSWAAVHAEFKEFWPKMDIGCTNMGAGSRITFQIEKRSQPTDAIKETVCGKLKAHLANTQLDSQNWFIYLYANKDDSEADLKLQKSF